MSLQPAGYHGHLRFQDMMQAYLRSKSGLHLVQQAAWTFDMIEYASSSAVLYARGSRYPISDTLGRKVIAHIGSTLRPKSITCYMETSGNSRVSVLSWWGSHGGQRGLSRRPGRLRTRRGRLRRLAIYHSGRGARGGSGSSRGLYKVHVKSKCRAPASRGRYASPPGPTELSPKIRTGYMLIPEQRTVENGPRLSCSMLAGSYPFQLTVRHDFYA